MRKEILEAARINNLYALFLMGDFEETFELVSLVEEPNDIEASRNSGPFCEVTYKKGINFGQKNRTYIYLAALLKRYKLTPTQGVVILKQSLGSAYASNDFRVFFVIELLHDMNKAEHDQKKADITHGTQLTRQPQSFAELFGADHSTRRFVEQAMKDLKITSDSGVCCLGERNKIRLTGFVRMIRNYGLISYLADTTTIPLFARYIQADIKPAKGIDKKAFYEAQDDTERYLKSKGVRKHNGFIGS